MIAANRIASLQRDPGRQADDPEVARRLCEIRLGTCPNCRPHSRAIPARRRCRPGRGLTPPWRRLPATVPSRHRTCSRPMLPAPTDGLRAFVAAVRLTAFARMPAVVLPGLACAASAAVLAAIAVATGRHAPAVRRAGHPPRISRSSNQQVHGKPLVWLDNAATTQKPQSVIDAVANFYAHDNSNIHRGAHTLAARATDAYEQARQKVQAFLGRIVGQGDHLRPRHDRRHQSRRADLRPEVPAAGRRDRPLHARTSRQHRALADDRQGKGRRAAGRSRDRPRRDHARRVPGAAGPAHPAGRPDAGLEQPGHDPARGRDDANGQALQRPRADRRGPVGCAHAGQRAATRLRLLRLLRATRFSLPRASAWFTPRKSCWKSCRPGKAAAT